MPNGVIKWFSNAKGFGFIEPEGGGPDVFAHFSAIKMLGFKTLRQGAKVSYEVNHGPKGDIATDIVEWGSSSNRPPHSEPIV